MAQIHVRIDERPDPDSGRRAFFPVVAVDHEPAAGDHEPAAGAPDQQAHLDPDAAIAAVERELQDLFTPGEDVVETYGRWFVTLTEVADKLRFLFGVNSAPSLTAG